MWLQARFATLRPILRVRRISSSVRMALKPDPEMINSGEPSGGLYLNLHRGHPLCESLLSATMPWRVEIRTARASRPLDSQRTGGE
jgi:hypothetical protein